MQKARKEYNMKEEIIRWLREWFEENGKGCNAVVSI